MPDTFHDDDVFMNPLPQNWETFFQEIRDEKERRQKLAKQEGVALMFAAMLWIFGLSVIVTMSLVFDLR